MKINVYQTLAEDITKYGMSVTELRTLFYELKSGYPPDFFGRDVPNSNSEIIHHVHIIPDESDPKRKQWLENCARNNQFQKTSDNFLFYADDGRSNYWLIAIAKPGGHAAIDNIDFMRVIEKIGEDLILGK